MRLPIGYWAFDVVPGEPYIQGQKDYLYRAIGWARSAGIKVMVRGGVGNEDAYGDLNLALSAYRSISMVSVVVQCKGCWRLIRHKLVGAPGSQNG